jgi:hypothetical protein
VAPGDGDAARPGRLRGEQVDGCVAEVEQCIGPGAEAAGGLDEAVTRRFRVLDLVPADQDVDGDASGGKEGASGACARPGEDRDGVAGRSQPVERVDDTLVRLDLGRGQSTVVGLALTGP